VYTWFGIPLSTLSDGDGPSPRPADNDPLLADRTARR